ncbi:dTDP-glucose pyrophosphorylase [Anaerocolumna jejuensis DSM 15929]|uniref:dTDP-glucose pyrophosphorylase n=1 Tax=Anaerocolumna jejuensis DSM 15929 TaxID=1121322 RepID=A0A1M7CEG9_9FIRM|nr:sugar phosphate nucleotidyltransferase [Anaerocolumna jejuensis]SHL65600.1 dTDP-glucose pyrophosphorylase [Anaerocolumna jejuensis DSM 15929]
MKKPILVIMAAGMGSRYGGLKQIDSVDEQGHIIIDFSIYDAIRAGFEKIVFIIKKEIEKDFKEKIGDRISKLVEVEYVYQEVERIPSKYQVPEGRHKPWGTGHAILCCKEHVDGPFAVINADDYYGTEAFKMIYNALIEENEHKAYSYAMVGYVLANTLTENGFVSRGVCEVNAQGYLQRIEEKTKIEKRGSGAEYSDDNGGTWSSISPDSIVSMNLWGFKNSIMDELEKSFLQFLEEEVPSNPLKSEFFLPTVVQQLLESGKSEVKVLKTKDKWFGVTYKEDKEKVVETIAQLKIQGVYPEYLWNE